MPSQYGEHELILSHFAGRVGRFLDIGAGDGCTFSNTEPLLDAGWSGVMVEPALGQLRWLIENHGDNPRVDILPALLKPYHGYDWHSFYEARDYSTCQQYHRDKVIAHSQGEISFRYRFAAAIDWNGIMALYPGPYQFLNIDVEGMNAEVLGMAPMACFEMVCIEIDPASELDWMKSHLRNAGLVRNTVIGGNLLAYR